jgi:hypothetical protein
MHFAVLDRGMTRENKNTTNALNSAVHKLLFFANLFLP